MNEIQQRRPEVELQVLSPSPQKEAGYTYARLSPKNLAAVTQFFQEKDGDHLSPFKPLETSLKDILTNHQVYSWPYCNVIRDSAGKVAAVFFLVLNRSLGYITVFNSVRRDPETTAFFYPWQLREFLPYLHSKDTKVPFTDPEDRLVEERPFQHTRLKIQVRTGAEDIIKLFQENGFRLEKENEATWCEIETEALLKVPAELRWQQPVIASDLLAPGQVPCKVIPIDAQNRQKAEDFLHYTHNMRSLVKDPSAAFAANKLGYFTFQFLVEDPWGKPLDFVTFLLLDEGRIYVQTVGVVLSRHIRQWILRKFLPDLFEQRQMVPFFLDGKERGVIPLEEAVLMILSTRHRDETRWFRRNGFEKIDEKEGMVTWSVIIGDLSKKSSIMDRLASYLWA